ncbi:MAG: NAD(P)-binding domain-containing protein, partial [Alphaproteobacteria bacterium]|nr:NAD(P)-binding domain-containing protein [Alphaproteobacteria bacterium]
MATENLNSHTIGWIGTGKMGYPMAARLIAAGVDVTVYNRTKAKAEPLGVTVVDAPADLADRDIVYTIVTDDTALREMVIGPNGVLSG